MLLYKLLLDNFISSESYYIINIRSVCILIPKNFLYLLNWANEMLMAGSFWGNLEWLIAHHK